VLVQYAHHDILAYRRENIYFAEESYAALKNNTVSLQYLNNISKDPDAQLEGSLMRTVKFRDCPV